MTKQDWRVKRCWENGGHDLQGPFLPDATRYGCINCLKKFVITPADNLGLIAWIGGLYWYFIHREGAQP